jgi:4-hydroxy-3-polyprenylbenzoate decarboxylase
MVLIVGITGASGVIYGIRLLEIVSEMRDIEVHLVISRSAENVIQYETPYKMNDIRKLANYWYHIDDMAARISSGSFKRDGMIVAPCTVKTMSGLANSYTENLLLRSGDVTLKERKPLVLLVREAPLHLGHIQAMLQLTQMGAIISPPIPSFYNAPKTIDDIINQTVGRTLDLLNIEHDLVRRWPGIGSEPYATAAD